MGCVVIKLKLRVRELRQTCKRAHEAGKEKWGLEGRDIFLEGVTCCRVEYVFNYVKMRCVCLYYRITVFIY